MFIGQVLCTLLALGIQPRPSVSALHCCSNRTYTSPLPTVLCGPHAILFHSREKATRYTERAHAIFSSKLSGSAHLPSYCLLNPRADLRPCERVEDLERVHPVEHFRQAALPERGRRHPSRHAGLPPSPSYSLPSGSHIRRIWLLRMVVSSHLPRGRSGVAEPEAARTTRSGGGGSV